MPVYACDFEAVKNASNQLREVAANMQNNISNCKSNVASDLSGWKGSASSSMESSNNAAYNTLGEDAETVNQMADYLDNTVNQIQAAESALSSLKI